MVSVRVWRSSSHVPAARRSNSLLKVSAPVGHTAMQLPQYTQAESVSGTACSVEMRASKPRPGHADGERALPLLAAGVDALVAEDALGVVPHVEVVVDLGGLGDGGRRASVGLVVVAGDERVPLALSRGGLDGGPKRDGSAP